MSQPVKIFIAYSRNDTGLLNEFREHLTPLTRSGRVKVWFDGEIEVGKEWEKAIKKNLESADIIVLMLSSSSIASDYFYGKEVAAALERHENGTARIVPLVVRPCLWKSTPIGKLQMVPKDGLAIVSWKTNDDGWNNAMESIERIVSEIETDRQAVLDADLFQKNKEKEDETARRSAIEEKKRLDRLAKSEAEKTRLADLAAREKQHREAEKQRIAEANEREKQARLAAEKAEADRAEQLRLDNLFGENLAAARQYIEFGDRKNARQFIANALAIRPHDAVALALRGEIEAMQVPPSFFEKNGKWLAVGAVSLVLAVFGLNNFGEKQPQPQPKQEGSTIQQPMQGGPTNQPVAENVAVPETKPKAGPPKTEPAKPVEQPKPANIEAVLAEIEASMVNISGGTFDMGDESSYAYSNEKPAHSVTVSSFYLSKFEFKQSWYKAIMETNPSKWKGDNLPVEQVRYEDIEKFIRKLNEKSGKNYRLPTEAEWEFAARERGKNVRFGNGKDIADPAEMNFTATKDYKTDYSVVGAYRQKTVSVGSFSPNSLGLYNMSGNVWEWCSDWYHEDYYKNSPQNNPKGPSSGSSRVYRGGSWGEAPRNCLSAARNGSVASNRNHDLGFRLARQ